MCTQTATQSRDTAQAAVSQPAYTVDPSHPLFSAADATTLLSSLPETAQEWLRSRARSMPPQVLVHIVRSIPIAMIGIGLVVDPERASKLAALRASVDEELHNRYVAGTLPLPLVQGREAAATYMATDEAKAAIAGYAASLEVPERSRLN